MDYLRRTTLSILATWWELTRIVLPVTIVTRLLMEWGVIAAMAPALSPLMGLYGLPPELAFALLAGVLVGLWNAVVLIFVLVPVDNLSVAQVTVFSCMVLGAHALLIEQAIIRRTGVSALASTVLRIGGALVFAGLVHVVLSATGWLGQPVAPAWIPAQPGGGWRAFWIETGWLLVMMLAILAALLVLLDALRAIGVLAALDRALAPVLQLAGIRGEAVHLTAVGMMLGIAYGGGLLIREARTGHVPRQQVFLACVLMGFCHSIIEDSALMIAVGADPWVVIGARLVFALAATALVAALLARRRAV